MWKLDDVDKEILRVLQKNCNKKLDEITEEVKKNLKRKKVPRTTVHSKIKRLEDLKIIQGYRAILDGKLLGKEVTAFIFLNYERIPDVYSKDAADKVIEELKDISAIQEIHILAGEKDILIKAKADSVDSLGRLVLNRLRRTERISASVTSIVFTTPLEDTRIDV